MIPQNVSFPSGPAFSDGNKLMSNQTTLDLPNIISRMTIFGIEVDEGALHSCLDALVMYLRESSRRRLHVIGVDMLRRFLIRHEFRVMTRCEVDAVVVGFDDRLDYAMLRAAYRALTRSSAELIALNANPTVIEADGREAPGVGAIVKALEYAADVRSVLVGKPGRIFYWSAVQRLGLPAEQVTVVSDDPLGDLSAAKRLGLHTVYVLSGRYPDPQVLEQLPPSDRPDEVYETIEQVPLPGR
jgi:4-nitrophenyl phosphatase